MISMNGKYLFFTRTRELLPPSEVAEETNHFLPIHHLLVMQTNSYRFGYHQGNFATNGIFLNTNGSCFFTHSFWGTVGRNHNRPHRVSEVTEPTESCHKQESVMDLRGEGNRILMARWNNLAYKFTIHNYFLVLIKAWYVSQNHYIFEHMSWSQLTFFSLTQTHTLSILSPNCHHLSTT